MKQFICALALMLAGAPLSAAQGDVNWGFGCIKPRLLNVIIGAETRDVADLVAARRCMFAIVPDYTDVEILPAGVRMLVHAFPGVEYNLAVQTYRSGYLPGLSELYFLKSPLHLERKEVHAR